MPGFHEHVVDAIGTRKEVSLPSVHRQAKDVMLSLRD